VKRHQPCCRGVAGDCCSHAGGWTETLS
jgi:hypothetical protein